ncbi:hypothetical protein EMIT0P294_180042 [Pseudomonas sp. IT-P294]
MTGRTQGQFERETSLEEVFWVLAVAVAVVDPDCCSEIMAVALAASILSITVSPPPSAIAATEAVIKVTIKRALRLFMSVLQ